MSVLPTYLLERTFDAPRELVWRTWTDPELLARWYGPNVVTIIHRLEVKLGGLWLNEMKMGANSKYQRAEYAELREPERLVCRMSNTDAKWRNAPNPRMPDWPHVLLTTVTFAEQDGMTKMSLTWVPHGASQAEIDCFANALAGMGKGWDAGMELLEKLLVELQA